jgi:hypothetical protein
MRGDELRIEKIRREESHSVMEEARFYHSLAYIRGARDRFHPYKLTTDSFLGTSLGVHSVRYMYIRAYPDTKDWSLKYTVRALRLLSLLRYPSLKFLAEPWHQVKIYSRKKPYTPYLAKK